MKKLPALVFCAITMLIFVSCGLRNAVDVVSFNPSGSVGTLTTFTLEFSKELAPFDVQDKWLTEEFIKFEPKIPGKFKWTSASTLIFSPDVQLEPIQAYSAEITKKVLFDKDLSLDAETIEFKTHDFDIKKVDLFWTHIPNQYYKVSVQANLQFNYLVNPDMLKQNLIIEHDGKPITNYQVVTKEKSDLIAVNFGEIQQTDKEQVFTITVKKGLMSVFGKQGLEDDRTFSKKLEPITKLAITGVASGFDGTTGWIEVSTTQMVDEKRLKEYVKTDPWKDLSFFVSDNSLRIEANLENVQDVLLKIRKGMPGLYGGELEFDFEQQVSFVNLEPSINFADKKGKYLMLGGNKNLQVNFVNIDEADIEVSQVFKNNLLWFLNQNSYYYYDYEEDYSYNSEIWTGDYGKTLYEEKINLQNNKNWLEKKYINLNRIIGQKYKGIYVVNARSAQDRWIADAKMIALTDLGIITKKSGNEIIVFVNSIAKAEPVEGVEISVISSNNQTLLSGKTDREGTIRFTDVRKKIEGFTPRLIVAETANDFNYIDLQETFIETSRFDVGGVFEFLEDVNTFIYSDRNIYRPGENVYLSAIIRNDKIEVVKDIPVFLKIITPTGKTFTEMKKLLNEEGSFEASFKTPEYVQTGEYRAEVYTGSNQLIGTYKFSVEDFVPDKIRLMLKSNKDFAFPGDQIGVNIDAEFLFGAKASGLKYESHINLRHRPFISKKFTDYDFHNSSLTNPIYEEKTMDGFLDGNGKGRVDYTVPNDIKGSGIVTCYTYVNVFDLTGRTVNRAATTDIYPKDYFIGFKSSGYYFGTNERLNFKTVVVDHGDKPIKGFNATVKLVRFDWQTVLKKDNNDRYFYASEEKEIVEWQKNMSLNGGIKDISFSITKSGRYELRISKEGDEEYQRKSFYAYGWVSTTASSFQVDKEGRVDIVFNQEKYEPGNQAKILFNCPFAGKLLVSFERNGVYDYQYIEMKNKSVEITVPVKDYFMPNVYVSATLFKKHTVDNSTPFLVGHGYASMKVEKNSNKLPVKIIAPEKIKPNTSQTITVKTAPERNIFVTLAAVDEGILQVKNFKTPDPYGYMYAKRGLKVESYDLYKLLLPEIVGSSSSGGGDEEMFAEMLKKRTNPITTKRFKLFAFWSGILKTNGNGEVKIPIKFPQFNGEVRLMAVAYTEAKFGSAEKPMKVADDLIIEPEIPRFLAQDDSLVMPVTLINTTSRKGKVNVNVKVDGPLKILTHTSQYAEVEPNATEQVIFVLKSHSSVGNAKIIIETSGMAKVKEEIDIAVRPVSPYLTYTGAGTIKGGASQNFSIPGGFLYGTQHSTLTISKFPAVKFAKQLKYLVGYPHGCIEQTVSKLFPQIYFAELTQLVAPEFYKTYNPVYYVKEGIRKVESMQLYDGSMAYWQGGTYPSWWGSVYAAHFLLEARNAGFEVKQDVLKNLLYYLSRKARERSTYEYYRYEGTRTTITKIANKEILYSLYVLALAGKGDISTMNYYKSRLNLVSADSKYLLAGAYAMMGKWSSYHELIPRNYKPEVTYRETGGCFDSEIRANALMLEILLEVEPNNVQIPYIVKYLVQKIDNVYSTQENAFVFMALGKAASSKAKNDVKVDVFVGKKNIGNYSGKDMTLTDDIMNGANVYLKGTGNGEVFYFWSTEGISVNVSVNEEDMYMKVRRTYYDFRTKAEITNNQFYQGQLLVGKISLTGLERSAENIVITDMLPSGFEIENPRLNLSTDISWQIKNPISIDYMDVRDDRLLLFTKLWTGATKEFTYLHYCPVKEKNKKCKLLKYNKI